MTNPLISQLELLSANYPTPDPVWGKDSEAATKCHVTSESLAVKEF